MKSVSRSSLCFILAALSQFGMAADGHYSLRVSSHSPIKPGEELRISFDMLNPNIGSGFYDVHCRMSANTFMSITMYMETLTDSFREGQTFRLNSTDYVAWYPRTEATLQAGLNTLDIFHVNSKNASFTIENADWRLSVGALFSLEGDCVSNPYV